MKKLYFIFLVIVILGFFFCSKQKTDYLEAEYKKLEQKYVEKARDSETREEIKNVLKERKKALKELAENAEEKELTLNDKITLAKIYIYIGEYDNSIRTYQNLLKKSKTKKKAYQGLIESYMYKRDTENSIKYLKEVKKEFDDLTDFAQYFLLAGLNHSDPDKAIEYLKIGLKHKLESRFNRYVPNGIEKLIKLKNMNREKRADLFEELKKMYAGDESVINALNKKEEMLNLKGSKAKGFNGNGEWINARRNISLDSLKGKYVVMEFFAPWCVHCRHSLPNLRKIYSETDRSTLEIIGITKYYGRYSDGEKTVDEVKPERELELIKEFLEKNKINYPVFVAIDNSIFDNYGVRGIPVFVFISPESKVLNRIVGAQPGVYKEIRNLIK